MIRLVDLAEYKRRQAPPGIKISTRAFGRDRRDADHQRLPRLMRSRLARACCAPLLAACALGGCGDTIQDKPIPHNLLEKMLDRPVPRLLGRRAPSGACR